MIMYIISEPVYAKSLWHSQIISGIQANKSKNTELKIIDAKFDAEISEDDVLLVIGTDFNWLDNVIELGKFYFKNRIIVLSNCDYKFKNDIFSIVCFDIPWQIKQIFSYFKKCKKSRIALYGFNPKSSSDILRLESFLKNGGKSVDIYTNSHSLSECCLNFSAHSYKYDGVICVNDYAAVSLAKNLKNISFYIVSCGDTILASKTTPSITNFDGNFSEFGKAACQACSVLFKNPEISSVTMKLKSNIVPKATTDFITFDDTEKDLPTVAEKEADIYYRDTEITEMMSIEELLNTCDETDIKIIDMVRAGDSTDAIAEKLYMSTGAIKYRLKNMYKICSASSKAEFINLLQKYIN